MSSERQRLFVAAGVPAPVADELDDALAALRSRHPELRWSPPSAWHLTLAFVGEVGGDAPGAVDETAARAARLTAPFDVALDGRLGTFGGRVLWAGIAAPEALRTLAEGLRGELSHRGLATHERPFSAHLTVARAPRRAVISPAVSEGWQGPRPVWRVDTVTVIRSRPDQGQARYEARSSWTLGA